MPAAPGPSEGSYRALAPHYDAAVGERFFAALRQAFDRLVPRYGLAFRDALDLGCGTGLFACHLARRYGARVLGVDNAPAMLAVAAARCRDCRVGFQRHDLRALDLPWRFDLVTANFDTLNHLQSACELRSVLQRAAALLRPGGHLLFDLLTPAAGPLLGPHGRRELRLAQGLVWQRIVLLPGARRIETHVRVLRRGAPARCERQRERLVPVTEAARALHDAGLTLRDVLDARTLEPAASEPPRALFVAVKAR